MMLKLFWMIFALSLLLVSFYAKYIKGDTAEAAWWMGLSAFNWATAAQIE